MIKQFESLQYHTTNECEYRVIVPLLLASSARVMKNSLMDPNSDPGKVLSLQVYKWGKPNIKLFIHTSEIEAQIYLFKPFFQEFSCQRALMPREHL